MVRFQSKVVSIEEEGNYSKLIHLADGSVVKTKVLIGCDGVNSVVAKWLGLREPAFTGRLAMRGLAHFQEDEGHRFEPKFVQFSGNGYRAGFIPCNRKAMYWFFTYTPPCALYHEKIEDEPTKMKEFVLKNLGKVPKELVGVVEKTEPDSIICSPLRLRWPLNLLFGSINKGNVCVAGDALHPMTPDIGQGGCSALEDGVVLARCLGRQILLARNSHDDEKEEYSRIKEGLDKFGKERKWRSFELISTAYMVGMIQESSGQVISFLRDKFLSPFLTGMLLKRAAFDCGELNK